MDHFVAAQKKRTWRTVGSFPRDHHEEMDNEHHYQAARSVRNGFDPMLPSRPPPVDRQRYSDSDLLKNRLHPQGMSFLRHMKSESNIHVNMMNVKKTLEIHKMIIRPKKQVHFNPVCKVVLIPQLVEYHGLEKDLYWTMAELKTFRQSAFKDVNMVIQQYHLDFQSTTKSMMNLSLVFQFKSELDISAAEEAEAHEDYKGSDSPTSPCHGSTRSIQDILETYPLPFVASPHDK